MSNLPGNNIFRKLLIDTGIVSLDTGNNFYSQFKSAQVSGTANTASTVYIEGAPYGGIITNLYSLYVASGLTSVSDLRVNGIFQCNNSLSLNGRGNNVYSQAGLYILPSSTLISGTNNYYFTYFDIPPTSGTTTGNLYNIYIAGSPSGGANNYSLYVANGIVNIASNIPSTSLTTGSLVITGGVGVSGSITSNNISVPNGTSLLPSYSFINDSKTGIYLINSNLMGITCNNNLTISFASSSINTFTTLSFLKVGSTTANASTLYSAPQLTTTNSTSDLYFNYFATPTTLLGSATATSASTIFIQGSPTGTGVTNSYSLNVASGKVYLQGNPAIQIPANASAGYVLVSDAFGNGTWQSLASAFGGFVDGSVSAPGAYFIAESKTGFYRPGSAQISVSLNGTNTFNFTSSNTNSNVTLSLTKSGALLGSPSTSALYVAPSLLSLSGSNNYVFTYYAAPIVNGSTTGSASTIYIEGAPTGATITTPYALNIANGTLGLTGASSNLYLANTNISTSSITGAINCLGGGYFKNLFIAGNNSAFPTMSGTLNGPLLNIASTTIQVNSNAEMAFTSIQQPTLNSQSIQTTSDVSTLYISGAPIAGTNQTINNPWALKVASGSSFLSGGCKIGQNGTKFGQVITGSHTFVNPNLSNNQSTTFAIDLKLTPFTSPPKVLVTLDINTCTHVEGIQVTVTSVVNNGFTIRLYNTKNTTTSGSPIVNYMCIGT
jgi:hypothetical protein